MLFRKWCCRLAITEAVFFIFSGALLNSSVRVAFLLDEQINSEVGAKAGHSTDQPLPRRVQLPSDFQKDQDTDKDN
jgi:hypothetical protein